VLQKAFYFYFLLFLGKSFIQQSTSKVRIMFYWNSWALCNWTQRFKCYIQPIFRPVSIQILYKSLLRSILLPFFDKNLSHHKISSFKICFSNCRWPEGTFAVRTLQLAFYRYRIAINILLLTSLSYSCAGLWSDKNCGYSNGFICQKRVGAQPQIPSTPPPIIGDCPPVHF